jgi:putative MATE family efflux protein
MPTLLWVSAPNLAEAAARITFLTADALFVSWLGGDALAAMAVVYPLFLIIQTSTASGFGAGVSACVGRALGAGDRERAGRLAGATLVLALVASALSSAVLLLAGPTLYGLLGAQGEVLALATTYGTVLFSGIGLVWLMNLLANVVRGSGVMLVPASAIFVGEACHLLLSPALILGWGPLPQLGIAGAAIGALSAYAVGAATLGIYLVLPRALARIRLRGLRLSADTALPILRIGVPAAAGVIAFGSFNPVVLWLLAPLGETTIAAFGIATRFETLLYPITFAFGSTVMATVATAIGAGDMARAARVARAGCGVGAAIGATFGAAAAFGAHWMAIFTTDPGIATTGATYLHLHAAVYPLLGAGLVAVAACYALGEARWPMGANLARIALVVLAGLAALKISATAASVFCVVALLSVIYGLAMLLVLRRRLLRA